MYLALEPPIRRRWPDLLIGWTRAISGQFRDPMLGRHVLYGALAATASALLGISAEIVEKSFRLNPSTGDLDVFNGVRHQLGVLFAVATNSFGATTVILFLVIGLTLLVRRLWLGALLAVVLLALLNALGSANPWLHLAMSFFGNGIAIVLLLRFGYLATWIVVATGWVMENFPPDLNWTAWFADTRALGLLFFLALLGYGYATATTGYREAGGEEEL
jgi:serine/threonine-protein kinase